MTGIKAGSVLALIALSSVAVRLHAEDRMRAGLWEVTHTSDGKTVGGLRSTCFTPAMVELANMPAKTLREATEKSATKGGSCTMKDFQLDGNKISMTLTCGDRVSAYASTYSGDAFETVINTTTEAGVKTVVFMKGRRTGDCK